MNLFKLAEIELTREGKDIYSDLELLDWAIAIRHWLDIHRQKTARKILEGGKIYKYGNRVIVSQNMGYNRFINQPYTNKNYLLED